MTRIRLIAGVALVGMVAVSAACREDPPSTGKGSEEEGWSVTAWGERYEIFAECRPLVAGRTATCHTHVTVLGDFSPLKQGTVAAVLRAGADETFARHQPARDGIYAIDLVPASTGAFDLLFRVESPAGKEEIAAGQVRVGDERLPGGAVEASAAATEGTGSGTAPGASGEPIGFLKEQQWRTEFATDRVREGSVHASVKGTARVRPVAGGEILMTAPVDGVLLGRRWPFVGLDVARGSTMFEITPRIDPSRSLAELEATRFAADAELRTARGRLSRLETLLPLEAVSRAEVEEARARVGTLEARQAAARQDLATATATRRAGSDDAEKVTIQAPFDGRVAEVRATPGQAVAAGDPLGRLVKVRPLWLEVALRPGDAAIVAGPPAGLALRRTGSEDAVSFTAASVRLVSRAPEVDPATGSVRVLLQVPGGDAQDLRIGSVLDAEILLQGERRGIVIPASATVDDGGVPVVYVQVDGETFLRREITIVARQADDLLVEGLRVGERLVTAGGGAIRRAALLSSGPIEGHVH